MTGDRLDQELPDDEEFVLDFGEEEAELFGDAEDESTPATDVEEVAADAAPVTPAEFAYELSEEVPSEEELDLEANDAALELFSVDPGDPNQDDELLDLSENDSFVLVDKTPEPTESGEVKLDPDDLLFDDHREELAAESDFGADLGPQFDRDNSFDMPDNLELTDAGENVEEQPLEIEAVAQEVDVEMGAIDDDTFLSVEESDDWTSAEPLPEAPVEPTLETDEQPAELGLVDEPAFGMRESTRDIEFDDGEAIDTNADLWDDEGGAVDPSHEEYDPIYGDAVEQTGETAEQEGGYGAAASYEEDFSEYEEAYADGTAPSPVGEVVGSVAPRSHWRMVAGLAAVLPIAAAGVIAFAKPEWFGGITGKPAQPAVLVDRVAIERPAVDLEVAPPVVAFHDTTAKPPTTTTDPETAVEPDSPVAIGEPGTEVQVTPDGVPTVVTDTDTDTDTDPVAVGPEVPVTPDPIPDPDPVTPTDSDPSKDPEIETPATDPETVAVAEPTDVTPEQPAPPAAPEFIHAGDNLLIGKIDVQPPELPVIAKDLRPGTQAFARLRNGSFFMGQVRRVDAAMITLQLPTGEIGLRYDELMALSPLANADLSEVTSTQRGFVRLNNHQRLFGAILRDPENGEITLTSQTGSVTVPNWQVSTVGFEAVGGVEIVNDGDDDWLRQRVRSRLTRRE